MITSDRIITSPRRMHLIELIREQRWNAVIKTLTSKNSADNAILFSNHYPITYLHFACAMPTVPIHVVKTIIKQYPNACLTEDEDGSLPIHIACSTPGMRMQVIETLMLASPKSCLRRENDDGELPMYLLCENNGSSNIEQLASHLISSTHASCIYDETTSLVHDIYINLLPEAIIAQIIEIYPHVCRITHKNGDTLLHILCSHSQVTIRTIRLVINLQPELCTKKDTNGNLPLHLVNARNHPEEIIRVLLNAYPQGMFIANAFGQIPLHVCTIRESPTKVKAILSHCDHSTARRLLCIKDKCGLTPVQDFYWNMQCCLTHLVVSSRNISLQSLDLECFPELKDQIESLFYLTTVYAYGSIDKIKPKRNLVIPHQLSFWTTFPALLTIMILRVAPYIAKVKDCNGAFPLHIVAKEVIDKNDIGRCSVCNIFPIKGPFLRHDGGLQICVKCRNNTAAYPSNDSPVLGMPLIEYHNHEVIKHTLLVYPKAASIPDSSGNLPLHLSLRAGKTWYTGVKEIFEAAPYAIHVQDRTSRQFPFIIAASKKLNDSCCLPKTFDLKQSTTDLNHQNAVDLLELTTVFELLRRDPCAVESNRKK